MKYNNEIGMAKAIELLVKKSLPKILNKAGEGMGRLREEATKLDNVLSGIGGKVEILSDIQVKMDHLKEDMDNAVLKCEEKAYYREHHREVRVLSELMFYTMQDLEKALQKSFEITQMLFDEIVKNEDEKTTIELNEVIEEVKKEALIAGNDTEFQKLKQI